MILIHRPRPRVISRQRQLEAQVQVAWAQEASSMLDFLIGREADPVAAMKEFIAIYDAAEERSNIGLMGFVGRLSRRASRRGWR